MFKKLSSEFDFNARCGFLADPIAQKLKEPAKHGASDNATDRQNESGKRFSQKDAGNDEAGESQPC